MRPSNWWLMIRGVLSGRPRKPALSPEVLLKYGERYYDDFERINYIFEQGKFTEEEKHDIREEAGFLRLELENELGADKSKFISICFTKSAIQGSKKRYRGLYISNVSFVQWKNALFVRRLEIAKHEMIHCLFEVTSHSAPYF